MLQQPCYCLLITAALHFLSYHVLLRSLPVCMGRGDCFHHLAEAGSHHELTCKTGAKAFGTWAEQVLCCHRTGPKMATGCTGWTSRCSRGPCLRRQSWSRGCRRSSGRWLHWRCPLPHSLAPCLLGTHLACPIISRILSDQAAAKYVTCASHTHSCLDCSVLRETQTLHQTAPGWQLQPSRGHSLGMKQS